MTKINTVLLDLDNTLYDYDSCNQAGLSAVYKRLSKETGKKEDDIAERFKEARLSVKMDLLGSGSVHSRLLYFKKLIESICGRTDAALTLETEALFWDEYFRHMKLFPNVMDFLKLCRKEGIRVVIITDLNAGIQLRKILRLDIASDIDYVVSSEEAGKEKPSPYVYLIALNKVGSTPEKALMIGDELEKDIAGARNLGIKAVHLRDKKMWSSYREWL